MRDGVADPLRRRSGRRWPRRPRAAPVVEGVDQLDRDSRTSLKRNTG